VGALDTGFTVPGVFRDVADFVVWLVFQKDDSFGHLAVPLLASPN
jgi:hypothetical protein